MNALQQFLLDKIHYLPKCPICPSMNLTFTSDFYIVCRNCRAAVVFRLDLAAQDLGITLQQAKDCYEEILLKYPEEPWGIAFPIAPDEPNA